MNDILNLISQVIPLQYLIAALAFLGTFFGFKKFYDKSIKNQTVADIQVKMQDEIIKARTKQNEKEKAIDAEYNSVVSRIPTEWKSVRKKSANSK